MDTIDFMGLSILSRSFFSFLFIDLFGRSRPLTTQSIFFFELVLGNFFGFLPRPSLTRLFCGLSTFLNWMGKLVASFEWDFGLTFYLEDLILRLLFSLVLSDLTEGSTSSRMFIVPLRLK